MNPIDKLSQLEKDNMVAYIKAFANSDENSSMAPIEKILSPWNEAKKNLFDSFGEELMFTKAIKYQADKAQLRREIDSKLYSPARNPHRLFKVNLLEAYKSSLREWGKVDNSRGWDQIDDMSYYLLEGALRADALVTSNLPIDDWYDRDTNKATFYLPDGKTMDVQRDTKSMRILGKLADALGVPGFEDFRVAHSQCLNQKELKGDLTISIHPMDYMTMSDNNSDWSSCMSWRNGGEYRQGTVEMMNSRYVVVAYLSAKNDMQWGNETQRWNNKKWRCLFVVDGDCIISVKPYPYYNKYLIQESIKEIAAKLGWESVSPQEFEPGESFTFNDHTFQLDMETNAMYNDFGSAEAHYIGINPAAADDHIYAINYSGLAECVWCGSAAHYWNASESRLCCDDCQYNVHCDECGYSIYDGDVYHVGDSCLCESCVNELCFWDCIRCEYDWNENMTEIRLSAGAPGEPCAPPEREWWVREVRFNADRINWDKYFTIPYNELPKDNNDNYYVTYDQVTEEGMRECFDLYHIKDLDSYLVVDLPADYCF